MTVGNRVIGLVWNVTMVKLSHHATIYYAISCLFVLNYVKEMWSNSSIDSIAPAMILVTAAVSSLKPDITVIRKSWFQDETTHSSC